MAVRRIGVRTVEDDHGHVGEIGIDRSVAECGPLEVGDHVNLASVQASPGHQGGGPLDPVYQAAPAAAHHGLVDPPLQVVQGAGQRDVPWLAGAQQPDTVLAARPSYASVGDSLQAIQRAVLAHDHPRAHGVVQDDDQRRRLVDAPAAADERPRRRRRQEQDRENSQEEKQNLPEANGPRVLLFHALEVAQRREGQPPRVVAVEEVQYQRHGHRQARQQEERVQQAHQPRRSRLCR